MTGEKTISVSSLTTAEQDYHLSRLNSMIDSWSLNTNLIFTIFQTSFALTASQGEYTIGNGGNFNMTRPIRIIDPCFIRDGDGTDSMLEILDHEAYGEIWEKTTDGTIPRYIYYDAGYSATSTAKLFFYPEPDSGVSTFINTMQPLGSFSTMSHNVLFPPGYQRAIETNYAIESAPGFAPVSQELVKIARESLAAVKGVNLQAPISRLDYGVGAGMKSNILTGP